MAYIKEFTIKGLAGRKNTTHQTLNNDVNIFFGLNGSGKTSLLKILHSAMEGDASSLTNVPFEEAEVVIYSADYKKSFVRTIKKADIIKTKEGQFIDGRSMGVSMEVLDFIRQKRTSWKTTPEPPKTFRGTWRNRYLSTSRIYSSATLQRRLIENQTDLENLSENQLDRIFSQSIIDSWTVLYSSILVRVRSVHEQGLSSILESVLSGEVLSPDKSLGTEEAFKRIKSFMKREKTSFEIGTLKQFERKYSDDNQLKNIVNNINRVENYIEKAMEPIENLKDLISKLIGDTKKLNFTETGIEVFSFNGEKIPLESFSSGEKQILRIFLEVLIARESTLIIDEPELSLHIDWQRELVKSMRILNSETQIILATHSPEIMAEIDDSKIFMVN